MKIVNIRRMTKYPERRLYSFSVVLSPFVVNGFVYNADKRSVMSPKDSRNRRIVKGFGVHWIRLRALVDAEIERIEQAQPEPASAQSDARSQTTSASERTTGPQRMPEEVSGLAA